MGAIIQIALADVVESPTNPRKSFDKDKLQELAESIKKHGVLQPVLARERDNGDYELVYGHRRARAAKLAGLTEIPAEVRELDDKTVLEIQVIENVQREDVHPLEEAVGYQQLVEQHKMPVEELAAKVGKSKAYVYGRMKLCELGAAQRKTFFEGEISAAVAYLLARIPKGNVQDEAFKELTRFGDVSAAQARNVIERQFMLELGRAPFDTKSATLVAAAGACTTCPKRTGCQPELFADVKSKDLCTDPGCFAKKKAAHVEIKLREAKAAGRQVLSPAECKKLFPSQHGSYMAGSEYVELASQNYQDPKYRTYKQLLGKKASDAVVIAVDQTGELHELVPAKQVAKLLKEAGHDFKVRSSSSDSDWQKQQRAAAEKSKRLMPVAKAAVGKVAAFIGEDVRGKANTAVWMLLANEALGSYVMDDSAAKACGAESMKALRAALPKLNVSQLQGVVAVKEMLGHLPGRLTSYPKWLGQICTAAGVDLKKLQDELAPKKPAPKKKPAAGAKKSKPAAAAKDLRAGQGVAACRVPLCSRAAVSKALCAPHYQKATRLKYDLDGLGQVDLDFLSRDGRRQSFSKPKAPRGAAAPPEPAGEPCTRPHCAGQAVPGGELCAAHLKMDQLVASERRSSP